MIVKLGEGRVGALMCEGINSRIGFGWRLGGADNRKSFQVGASGAEVSRDVGKIIKVKVGKSGKGGKQIGEGEIFICVSGYQHEFGELGP